MVVALYPNSSREVYKGLWRKKQVSSSKYFRSIRQGCGNQKDESPSFVFQRDCWLVSRSRVHAVSLYRGTSWRFKAIGVHCPTSKRCRIVGHLHTNLSNQNGNGNTWHSTQKTLNFSQIKHDFLWFPRKPSLLTFRLLDEPLLLRLLAVGMGEEGVAVTNSFKQQKWNTQNKDSNSGRIHRSC